MTCIGAPEHIMRMHKVWVVSLVGLCSTTPQLLLAVLACRQLEAFVLVASMGLWVDVLFNTAIGFMAEHTSTYNALFITTTVVRIFLKEAMTV